jgi:hypothetical protein
MKTVAILTVTSLALASAPLTPSALAGDREWAVAGKVLVGVAAAGVIAHALAPEPCVRPAPVVWQAPPAYVVQRAPVCAPAPVFVQAPVVVCAAPAPFMIQPPPVYIIPGPVYVHHPIHRHGFRTAFCR